jgi:DNA transformation protein
MSGNSEEFVAFVMDQLAGMGDVQNRRLFGGRGLARDGANFALLAGDGLFFVVDEQSRSKYLAAGMQPFWYTKKTGRVWVRRYHQVPPEVLEDADTLVAWAEEAFAIAWRTRRR